MRATASILALATMLAGCATAPTSSLDAGAGTVATASVAAPASAAPTAAEADAFVQRAEEELARQSVLYNRAEWANLTYITDDTDALAAYFGARSTELGVKLANEAARYGEVEGLSYDTRRKLNLLRSAINLPAASTPGAAEALSATAVSLNSAYGKGKGTLG
ncbi:MAG TPA: M2 family metallopeptidase, partial [Microvirga sp.]|nr:M2 family metallopeptidase [Microvirga sp.]